jgi:photosystem II stability/assembly factor-like uncharacterized protein
VNDDVAWVSGSKGHVGRTTDGGKTWTWSVVAGHESNDFRAIEAFDGRTALIVSVASPGYILKTRDAGKTWKAVYTDTTKDVFMDAMAFGLQGYGVVIGDPLDGKVYAYETSDSGDTWKKVKNDIRPDLLPGEAFFATSNGNLQLAPFDYRLVSGGMHARFFRAELVSELPLVQGRQSTGANAIAGYGDTGGDERIVVVGGDFTADTVSTGNSAYSLDHGSTWHIPMEPPHGYRGSVIFLDEKRLIACGTSGVDISEDGGVHWRLISKESYHVVRKANEGQLVLLAGAGGRMAKLVW